MESTPQPRGPVQSVNPAAEPIELSVVMPAYNEESRLEPTVRVVLADLRRRGIPFELILVDDGSLDRTGEVAKACAERNPEVRVISYRPNRGKGYAVRRGVELARGSLILMMNSELSFPMSELDTLLAAIRGCDIAVGSRCLPGSVQTQRRPLWKEMASRAARVAIRTFLRLPVWDTQCAFKLYRSDVKRLFERQRLERYGFDFEVLYLARRAGFRIREVPVTCVDDGRGQVRARDYWRTFLELWRVKRYHGSG